MGYDGDPYSTPIGRPRAEQFDVLAKKYAQDKGHDGILYEEGSLDAPELHVFEKTKKPKTEKVIVPGIKDKVIKAKVANLNTELKAVRKNIDLLAQKRKERMNMGVSTTVVEKQIATLRKEENFLDSSIAQIQTAEDKKATEIKGTDKLQFNAAAIDNLVALLEENREKAILEEKKKGKKAVAEVEKGAYRVLKATRQEAKKEVKAAKKEGQAIAAARAKRILEVKHVSMLTPKEIKKLVGSRDVESMAPFDFHLFLDRLAIKADNLLMLKQAKLDVVRLIRDMEFENEKHLRVFMGLPPIQNMSIVQIQEFTSALTRFEVGDVFLTPKAIKSLVESSMAKTKREQREFFSKKHGVPVEDIILENPGEYDLYAFGGSERIKGYMTSCCVS